MVLCRILYVKKKIVLLLTERWRDEEGEEGDREKRRARQSLAK
jgi:hypothetical protein